MFNIKTKILFAATLVSGILLGNIFSTKTSPSLHTVNPSGESHSDYHDPAENTLWTCSMHPQIKLPKPGLCPICNMDLIPLDNKRTSSHPRELILSESDMKLAEIQTTPLVRKFVEVSLRLPGKVQIDETKVKSITSWFPYRIDRLFVDYTGILVREGDHLAEIYSPDLLTAQEELLEAWRRVQTNENESDFLKASNHRALDSAKEKLRLFGLLPGQIQEIIDLGITRDHIVINAPLGGTVIHKGVRAGEYVQTGTKIFTIADLRYLWVVFDAYEKDLPWIRYGQKVQFHAEAYPGETFEGTVTFIDPLLDKDSRTAKIRIHVENPEHKLKPEMFVRGTIFSERAQSGKVMEPDLELTWMCPMHPEVISKEKGQCPVCEMDLAKASELGYKRIDPSIPPVVVPETAVLRTGKRSLVYVRLPGRDQPTFQGREIILGPKAGNEFIVLGGIDEGEEVVVNGNFKIDSSLQIEARPSMMSMPGEAETTTAVSDQKFSKMLSSLFNPYFDVVTALSNDDLAGAKEACNKISEALPELQKHYQDLGIQNDTWTNLYEHSLMSLNRMQQAEKLDPFRKAFSHLSATFIKIQNTFGHVLETYYKMHCPMALKGKGADWLQTNKEISNPYFGAKMLGCGSVEEAYLPEKGVA